MLSALVAVVGGFAYVCIAFVVLAAGWLLFDKIFKK